MITLKNRFNFGYMKLHLVALCLFFYSTQIIIAQRNVRDSSIATPLIGVHYGGNFTDADLAERYGYLNHVGITAGYKTARNWYMNLDGNFMFGNQTRMTGLFDGLVDEYGNITDINGDIAVVLVYPRGFNANLSFGKIFPVLSPNANSGILFHVGAGYLMHRLRIETNDQVVPSLELDYKKGYDRLTTGINFHQFLGYSFLANSGAWNFYGGFYIQEGLTKNRRTIFFDQPDVPVSTKTRLDIQYGFRLGWYIPFYRRIPKDYYFE
jgi:hypothetical protein